jgi:hypothetical protein
VQLVLTRYAIERLLYRLSVSPPRDRFILKGAILFTLWSPTPYRATGDLYLLGYGDAAAGAIVAVFREICTTNAPDDRDTDCADTGLRRRQAGTMCWTNGSLTWCGDA